MPRKTNHWLTTPKYNLRRNYHHYNLRSSPLVIRRQPIVPRRTIVRRRAVRSNLEPSLSAGELSLSSSPEVGIINVNSTLPSSATEFNSSDETASEEFRPDIIQGFPGHARLRFPFSVSQPAYNRYQSPRVLDYLAGGDGHYNNMYTFHLVRMGLENQQDEGDTDGDNDDIDLDNFNEGGDYAE